MKLLRFMLPLLLVCISLNAAAWEDLSQQQLEQHKKNALVLDVRTQEEFAQGHVPGAINIPFDEISERLDELLGFKQGDIVVYCRTGKRAEKALTTLTNQGFEQLFHLSGDMQGWQQAKLPIETSQ